MYKDNIFKQFTTKHYRLTIYNDEDCQSPREWDNLGTFVMYHSRYSFGDINNPTDMQMEEIKKDLAKAHEKCQVFMIDHSGIGFSTRDFGDHWDSGSVGYIYVTYETIQKEFGDCLPETLEKARLRLKEEIEELNLYARGECYGYIQEIAEICAHCNHTEWIEVDSCWGFITTNPIERIKENLDKHILEEFKEELK